MEIHVTRTYLDDPGDFLRRPVRWFTLWLEIRFSVEELWTIEYHNLYHQTIFNRTPEWYASALQKAEQAAAAAKQRGERYEWPWWVPERSRAQEEWMLTVERALRKPIYRVTFATAAELDRFEPRLRAAFEDFNRFLQRYGSRPRTIVWRF